MERIILDDIPCQFEAERLMERLHIAPDRPEATELAAVVRDAEAVARPKAVYQLSFIEERGENTVVIDGITFTSRVLQVNLEETHRIFAYTATCGTELDEWEQSLDDVLHQYWADSLKEQALRQAVRHMNRDMDERFQLGRTSSMNPGSLPDWPLRQQRPLFELLGGPEELIGVHLTESCLMVPNKSVSGIRFPTETSFASCQLCPRPNCVGRRAPYDAELYERRYASRDEA